jgi:hypothetical protein
MSQIYIPFFFSKIRAVNRILLNSSADYHKAITPRTLAGEQEPFPQAFSQLRGKAQIVRHRVEVVNSKVLHAA